MFIGSDCCYESQWRTPKIVLPYAKGIIVITADRKLKKIWRRPLYGCARVPWRANEWSEWRSLPCCLLHSSASHGDASTNCLEKFGDYRKMSYNQRQYQPTAISPALLYLHPRLSMSPHHDKYSNDNYDDDILPLSFPNFCRPSEEKLNERRSIPALTRANETALSGSGRPRQSADKEKKERREKRQM